VPRKRKPPKTPAAPVVLEPVRVCVADLVPHPRNYKEHPPEQLAHLRASMHENGVYRNVVIADDGATILAGHGVVQAARLAGVEHVYATRVPFAPDSPRALKLVAGDNEVTRLAIDDDRLLTEILKEVKDSAAGLVGTGVDEAMLANMLLVTRPRSEIRSIDEAAAWVGMPAFEPEAAPLKISVQFRSKADRARFVKLIGYPSVSELRPSVWWPKGRKHDLSSVRFQEAAPKPKAKRA